MCWIVLISHNTYIYLYVYMAFWPKIFSRNSFIHQYFCIIILFFLVLGLYSNIGILAVTCPGFPGYCSESFPGMTCVVVCSRGRPNVPLCQVMIMTFFFVKLIFMFGKKIMMAIDCQITSGSDSFLVTITCPTCIHIELDDVLRLDFLVVPTQMMNPQIQLIY